MRSVQQYVEAAVVWLLVQVGLAARIAGALRDDAFLVSDPHDLAWAFNLRGADVGRTRFAVRLRPDYSRGGPQAVFGAGKTPAAHRPRRWRRLASLAAPEALADDCARWARKTERIRVDSATVPAALTQMFSGAGGSVELAASPTSP